METLNIHDWFNFKNKIEPISKNKIKDVYTIEYEATKESYSTLKM
jgi:hypothetical protein